MKRSIFYRFSICLFLGVTVWGCGNNRSDGSDASNSSAAGKSVVEVAWNYIYGTEKEIKAQDWLSAEMSLLNLRDAFEALALQERVEQPEVLPRIDALMQLANRLDEQIKNRNSADSLLTIEEIDASFAQTTALLNSAP